MGAIRVYPISLVRRKIDIPKPNISELITHNNRRPIRRREKSNRENPRRKNPRNVLLLQHHSLQFESAATFHPLGQGKRRAFRHAHDRIDQETVVGAGDVRFLQGKSAGLVDGGRGQGQTGLGGGRGREVVVDSGGLRREAAGAEGAADDDGGARLLLLVGGALVAFDLAPSP